MKKSRENWKNKSKKSYYRKYDFNTLSDKKVELGDFICVASLCGSFNTSAALSNTLSTDSKNSFPDKYTSLIYLLWCSIHKN